MLKLLLIGLALVGSIACQDCYTSVVKYFQCKYFYPLMKPSAKGEAFAQDPMINYDLVSEQFILTQNLTNYTDTAKAMGFFQKIYKEMVKNKCWSTKFLDTVPGKYSPIFLKKGYFDAAVEIITAHKAEFKPYILTAPRSFVRDQWKNYAQMPTLTSFCLKNDFSSSAYEFYNTTKINCGLTEDQFTEYFFTCNYPSIVPKGSRKVVAAPNAKQIVQTAQCSVGAAKSCSKETKRFWSFTDWADFLPKLKVPATKDKALTFFDNLALGTNLPSITFNFSYLYADWSKTSLNLRGTNITQTGGGLNCSIGFSDMILSTKDQNLVVEGTWKSNADSTCSLSSVTIKSVFLIGGDSTKTFNILKPEFKDKSYQKNPTKKFNWLYQRSTKSKDGHSRTEINELEWNAFLAFEEDHIEAFVPKDQLSSASGILVDGFDNEDIKPLPAGRKRRDADDQNEQNAEICSRQCNLRRKRWTGPVLDDSDSSSVKIADGREHWNSFIVQHATSPSRCVIDCMNKLN